MGFNFPGAGGGNARSRSGYGYRAAPGALEDRENAARYRWAYAARDGAGEKTGGGVPLPGNRLLAAERSRRAQAPSGVEQQQRPRRLGLAAADFYQRQPL